MWCRRQLVDAAGVKKESGEIRRGDDLLWSVVGSVYCFYVEILYITAWGTVSTVSTVISR